MKRLPKTIGLRRLTRSLPEFTAMLRRSIFLQGTTKVLEAAERALEIDPSYGGAHGCAGYAYVEKREYNKAFAEFQEAGRMQGARAWMGRLGHLFGITSNREEAM